MDDKVKLITSIGFAPEFAESLAENRTLAQIRKWVSMAKEANVPTAYFKAAHRRNAPVVDKATVKRDAEAVLAETADPAKEERRRRRDRVYLRLQEPDHPWREETFETREALLLEFGFHRIAAAEMARRSSLAEIIQWIDASDGEENPWVFVRQQLIWHLCEPAWPDEGRQPAEGDVDLLLRYGSLGKWLRLPDGRAVVHRPCPEGWARHTEQLRDLLGKEPWADYSGRGGREVSVGLGIRPSLDPGAEAFDALAEHAIQEYRAGETRPLKEFVAELETAARDVFAEDEG